MGKPREERGIGENSLSCLHEGGVEMETTQ